MNLFSVFCCYEMGRKTPAKPLLVWTLEEYLVTWAEDTVQSISGLGVTKGRTEQGLFLLRVPADRHLDFRPVRPKTDFRPPELDSERTLRHITAENDHPFRESPSCCRKRTWREIQF